MTFDGESQRLAVLAFEHAPVALSVLSVDRRQLYANDAYCAMLRVSRDQLGSLTAESITHPDDVDRTREYLMQLAAGEIDEVVTEKRYMRADGTSFIARLTATPLRSADGTIVAMLGVIRDLTDQELFDRAQRDLAAQQAVALVAADTAHELNNVLASMLMKVDLAADALEHPVLDELHELLARASKLGEQLLGLADDTTRSESPLPSTGGEPVSRPTVLVVDDEPSLLASVGQALRRSGYAVFEAASADEALEVIWRENVGVLVTDIAMAGMDGVALAEAVHATQPDLPVLFITGFAGSEVTRRLPADAVILRKPFRALDLVSSVERIARVGA